MRSISFLSVAVLSVATLHAQNHWYVSPSGSDANAGTSAGTAFQTINFAASVAANGDVLHLAAATFGNEQGNVILGTKTLTLVGAGMGQTIVKAHTSSDVMLTAGLLATPVVEAHRPALTVLGTARVDLRDLTLDNGFNMPGTGRGYSLWIGGGADMVADHVEFTNARTNPINGIQGPLAVNIRGDNAFDPTLVTLRSCWVHDFGKGGVVANFNAHLVMDDTRVAGFGHAFLSLAAQNAVQVSRGATCSLHRCTITDSWYDPDTVTATGVLFFDCGPSITIEDCNFGNCQTGIYFFGSAPAAIAATIRRNRIQGAEFGIYSDVISGLNVTDNSFSTSKAGDNNDAWDDAGGNTWSGNNYSSITVAGPHTLPGTGLSADATAKPFARGFGAAVSTLLPGSVNPVDLAVTNLDADSDSDFAALSQGATSPVLSVGINSGGSFAVTNLPFGSLAGSPIAIVAGEFNGAAGRDLAVLTVNVPPALTENKVYVFANNGSGSFSLLSTTQLTGMSSPSGLAAGNVDTGADDLAVSDAGTFLTAGTAQVLRNDGNGTTFTSVSLTAAFTAACRDAAIGDFNGDGKADVAITEGNASSGRVHLFQGDGLGGFTTFAGSPLATSANVNSALVTDLEGDGDQDLLVSCTRDALGLDTGTVDAFENNGGGTFTRREYRTDRGPTALAAGDFDADADPDSQRRDVAVVNLIGGSVSVLGQWTTGSGFGAGGIASTGSPTGVGIADIDGDGYADLLYADAAAGTVVVRPGVVQARADSYGAGSTGTSGRVPYMQPLGAPTAPTINNPSFGLGVTNARPLAVAIVAAALTPTAITPNSVLISNISATWIVVTNVRGEATMPMPIPNTGAFAGFAIYCQAGVFDPNATESFFSGIALTQGLKVRLGF